MRFLLVEIGLTGSGKRIIILGGDVSVKVLENCGFGAARRRRINIIWPENKNRNGF